MYLLLSSSFNPLYLILPLVRSLFLWPSWWLVCASLLFRSERLFGRPQWDRRRLYPGDCEYYYEEPGGRSSRRGATSSGTKWVVSRRRTGRVGSGGMDRGWAGVVAQFAWTTGVDDPLCRRQGPSIEMVCFDALPGADRIFSWSFSFPDQQT